MRDAERRLDYIKRSRSAATLADKGIDEDDIAATMGVPLANVRRLIHAGAQRQEHPAQPDELILTATVTGSSRTQLVRQLSVLAYTYWQPAPDGLDGGRPGAWDQVCVAHLDGLLTDEEYDTIKDAAGPRQ